VRITYLHSAPVPSRSANSIQVMRTCDTLTSLGHDVTLVAIDGCPTVTDEQVHAQYGTQSFSLRRTADGARFGPLRRYVRSLDHVLWARRSRADVLYGRDPITLALATRLLRRPAVLELHADPKEGGWGHRLGLFILQRDRHLRAVATNSAALRDAPQKKEEIR
jgi:hypothetical protein